jgi:hypothetical protein
VVAIHQVAVSIFATAAGGAGVGELFVAGFGATSDGAWRLVFFLVIVFFVGFILVSVGMVR